MKGKPVLTSFNDIWRTYRWSEELWDRFVKGMNPAILVSWTTPKDRGYQAQILAFPIYRILTQYLSYGMTPIALAAITRQDPLEVLAQLGREKANYLDWCGSTQLPVIDRHRSTTGALNASFGRVKAYDQRGLRANVDSALGLPLEEWLKDYPLRKCSVNFHRREERHYISPKERRCLRQAFTLGLTPEEAKPHLLSLEEQKEIYAIAKPKPPRVLSLTELKAWGCSPGRNGWVISNLGFAMYNYICPGFEPYWDEESQAWLPRPATNGNPHEGVA